MSRIFRRIFPVAGAMFMLAACKPGVPSGVIPPSTLEELLYDYHVAQAVAEANRDSMEFRRYAYVRAVLDKYGVTEAEFDSTMVWYSSHSVYLNDIYKNLKERFAESVSVLGEVTGNKDIFANLDASGDTADIWQERTFRILKPQFAADRMQFAMNADTSFRKGDDLMWRFDSYNISKERTNDVYAGLFVKYDNDSTVGVTHKIFSNSNTQLRLNGDTAHAVKSIGGFVWYKKPDEDKGFKMLVLDHIMLIRIHRHIEPPVADTISVRSDSDSVALPVKDSLDKAVPVPNAQHRLSPTELRNSRPSEHSIQVVKEKPYKVSGNTSRGTKRENSRRK